MRIQCESNAHQLRDSRPHCIVRNRIHACMLTSSGHTSTQLPWRPRQIFTSASHHIASRVEQIRGTQCGARRSALTVSSRHEHACHALFGPHVRRNCTIQFNPDWTNAHSVWTRSNRIQSGSMRIGCPVWTGLNLATCTYKLLNIFKIPIGTVQNLVYSCDLLSAFRTKSLIQ